MSPSAVSQEPVPAPPKSTPSSQRCEPGSINVPIAKWPKTPSLDGPIDALSVANDLISQLNTSLSSSKEGVASLFHADECYWRDHLALSWELQTLKGRDKIAAAAAKSSNFESIAVDASTEYRAPKVASLNPEQTSKGIIVYLTFSTKVGRGRGLARLVQDESEGWKIWTLFTGLEELKGFEEPIGPRRAVGVAHGYHHGRKNWLDRRREELEFVNGDPDVIILGMYDLNSFPTSCSCCC